ncbi:MAG TPA: PEP-CTERM sorting domain-containing protein [Phycisphaerae bacterium]|nr:PEP-CTERM sorting domain-containing protein [Phycisphaerae bacterium]
MNKCKCLAGIVSIVTAVSAFTASHAQAALLPPTEEAAFATQSSASDSDLFLLTEFCGFQQGETFDYQGVTEDLGDWQASVAGTHLGVPVSVAYNGDFTGYAGSPVTWTSAGTYGSESWSGNGQATFNPTADGFTINYSSTLTVGANRGDIDYSIDADYLPDGFEFVDGSGTVTINGIPKWLPRLFTFRMKRWLPPSWESDIHVPLLGKIFDNNCNILPDVGDFEIDGVIQTVPEPATVTLVVLGGLVALRRRRVQHA